MYNKIGEAYSIQIKQIKVVTRLTFLIVVTNPVDQKRIIIEPFLKMGNKVILAMPWTVDIDANTMKTSEALCTESFKAKPLRNI